MAYLSYTKKMPGVADVFLRDPDLYGPLLQFLEVVMTGPSELSKPERELIAAHVSRRNGCHFCVGAHRWTLAEMGVDWKTIDAVTNGNRSLPNKKMEAMLHFAGKLTATPEQQNRSDIDVLLKAGWSEQGIEDAINVVALFNYVNRLVDALGIENDESYFRRIGKALAERGYAPLLHGRKQRVG